MTLWTATRADLEPDAGPLGDEVGVRLEQPHERGADVSAAEQADSHDVRHPAILADDPTPPRPVAARSARNRAVPGRPTDPTASSRPITARTVRTPTAPAPRERDLEIRGAQHGREIEERAHGRGDRKQTDATDIARFEVRDAVNLDIRGSRGARVAGTTISGRSKVGTGMRQTAAALVCESAHPDPPQRTAAQRNNAPDGGVAAYR